MRVSPNHVFGRNLRAALPRLQISGYGKARQYCGIKLSEEGRTQYAEASRASQRRPTQDADE